MLLSRDIQRSFPGKGRLSSVADQRGIDVNYKIELSGVLVDADTLGERHRLPDWRTVKGALTLNSQDDGPLDPDIEYLLVLNGDFECRVRVKPKKKRLNYDVVGTVSKAPE